MNEALNSAGPKSATAGTYTRPPADDEQRPRPKGGGGSMCQSFRQFCHKHLFPQNEALERYVRTHTRGRVDDAWVMNRFTERVEKKWNEGYFTNLSNRRIQLSLWWILRYCVLEAWKQYLPRPSRDISPIQPANPDDTSDVEIIQRELRRAIFECLRGLQKKRVAMALVYYYLRGWTWQKVANKLGYRGAPGPKQAVKRVEHMLRACLARKLGIPQQLKRSS